MFGPGDEEHTALMNPIPAGEVEDIDVMNTASVNNNDGEKVVLERQQGVEFDGGPGAAEGWPT